MGRAQVLQVASHISYSWNMKILQLLYLLGSGVSANSAFMNLSGYLDPCT